MGRADGSVPDYVAGEGRQVLSSHLPFGEGDSLWCSPSPREHCPQQAASVLGNEALSSSFGEDLPVFPVLLAYALCLYWSGC